MKRAACAALARSRGMGTTAFEAERNPIVWVNREAYFLNDRDMEKKGKGRLFWGKWMKWRGR